MNDESALIKELVLQVRKVIGPFAAPKKIYIVGDLPKTRSGKVRKITFICPPKLIIIQLRSCAALCVKSSLERVIN